MILVLDFGSQYNQLIARKIRSLSIYSQLVPYNYPLEKIRELNPKGIVLSGGPANVYAPNAPSVPKELFEMGIPVLGICYGMQVIGKVLGGKVTGSDKREYGFAQLAADHKDPFFEGLPDSFSVWMSHQDKVTKLPRNFVSIGKTDNCSNAVIKHKTKPIYGVQFHPEVKHTQHGAKIFKNFATRICGIKANWRMADFIENQVKDIRDEVGKRRVVCGVSGGVDSTVLAVLLRKAIGERLKCVFVDNGVLRENEAETVVDRFNRMGIKVKHVRASRRFLSSLKGVANPEEKRKIIGREFINVFFKELGRSDFLAQGTLYPDVIESVSTKGPSATIKTHHNRVQEVLDLIEKGRVIEPLKELFKDEVRKVGKKLGIPDEAVLRQPFPGPGLAVRIIGEITKKRLDVVRRADVILIDEMKAAGLYHKIWQTFCVLLPVKSVGVMGDERTYENTIVIRAVNSVDGMTADWVKLPYKLLNRISNRIINEVKGVNRVVYDISSKPPSTIEWE